MRQDSVLKALVTDHIEAALKEFENIEVPRTEVQRVSPMVIQFKVWEPNGPPRYLNVHVKELM